MKNEKQYQIERIDLSRKVRYQLRQEIRLLEEETKASGELLNEMKNETELIAGEISSVRKDILHETMLIESENSVHAKLDYIRKSRLDQIEDLKIELGRQFPVSDETENCPVFSFSRSGRERKLHPVSAGEVVDSGRGNYSLSSLAEVVREQKEQIKAELLELKKELKGKI